MSGRHDSGTRRTPVGRVAAALLVMVALLAAACSDTEDDDAVQAGQDGTAEEEKEEETRTTRGVTDTSVKVGGMIYSAFFSGADIGAQARIERANADGGVHGRTIEFVGVDDTNNEQAKSLAIAQRLIQQEQVFALLPVTSSEVGIVELVKREKVPFFGYGIDPAFCGNEWAFGITGCVTDPHFRRVSNAAGNVMKEYFDGDTDKTVALIGEDFDAGRGGIKLLTASLASMGFEIVYAKNPVPAPPSPVGDFSPFVAEVLRSADGQPPDFIYGVLTGASAIGFYGALEAAGYQGLTVIPSYDPRVAAIVDGAASIIQFAPYEAAGEIPLLQEMIDDVKAVQADQLLTIGVAAGYWAADMFLALLEETGEDLTVERFLAASDGWSYEVPDIIGPSEWPRNHEVPVPCASLAVATDGTYEVAVPLTCGSNFELDE
jgi:ABC-type branched-subunit amino acid transport system substrate-binding protein